MYRVFHKKLHKVYAPQFCNRAPQSYAVFSKMFRKKMLTRKGQCLNTAIKYSLLVSWQVNYLKTKQSSWWYITFCFHIGIGLHVIDWLLEGISTVKNLFTREPSTTSLALRYTFLQTLACIQSFQFVCCCQGLNFTSRRQNTLSCKSFLAILTTKECEIPVSLAISHGVLLVPVAVILGCKLSQ